MTATSSFFLRVYKLRVSPRISYVEVPFKDSTLSTFRAYSGTPLTNAWTQFKSSPNADICACFYPVFSQAKLHWLSKAFCLSKNIRFDLSIAQWQLITAQNRDFSFFFKHNKKIHSITGCLLPLKLSSPKTNRNEVLFSKEASTSPEEPLQSSRAVKSAPFWVPKLPSNSAADSDSVSCVCKWYNSYIYIYIYINQLYIQVCLWGSGRESSAPILSSIYS